MSRYKCAMTMIFRFVLILKAGSGYISSSCYGPVRGKLVPIQKYRSGLSTVIPVKTGIQYFKLFWMPDQVRHERKRGISGWARVHDTPEQILMIS
jgi:hypothetical protein